VSVKNAARLGSRLAQRAGTGAPGEAEGRRPRHRARPHASAVLLNGFGPIGRRSRPSRRRALPVVANGDCDSPARRARDARLSNADAVMGPARGEWPPVVGRRHRPLSRPRRGFARRRPAKSAARGAGAFGKSNRGDGAGAQGSVTRENISAAYADHCWGWKARRRKRAPRRALVVSDDRERSAG